MFGTPGGGGLGLKGPVFGNSGNAKKIAFVCDASGSMLQKFDALKRELSKTIRQLRPSQSFSVIFFQEQSYKALDQNLLIAKPDTKRQADQFLDTIVPRAETNPIPALELAFKQKPDLIYVLTDGDFPDNNAVLNFIQLHDKDGKVKINTIAFVNEKDKDTDFMGCSRGSPKTPAAFTGSCARTTCSRRNQRRHDGRPGSRNRSRFEGL